MIGNSRFLFSHFDLFCFIIYCISSRDNIPTSSSEVWKLLESIKRDPTLAELRSHHKGQLENEPRADGRQVS